MFDIIVASTPKFEIGYKGHIPWLKYVPEESAFFKTKTQDSILIVGKTTLLSLPHLKNRIIICITRQTKPIICKNAHLCFNSLEHALQVCPQLFPNKKIFVAGGGLLYSTALTNPQLDKVHISIINSQYLPEEQKYDTHINLIHNFVIEYTEDHTKFNYYVLKRQDKGEYQYLELFDKINKEEARKTRNAMVKSVFHHNLSFDLREGFPLLTTKKMFFKGIVKELLFFLRGETDSKILENDGVKIWEGNTDRKFLDSINMHSRREGLMGPMYGYNWRHFGAEYDEESGRPKEKGVDQLSYVINTIINDPNSRRIIMTTYDPKTTDKCVLFPCHSLISQFYVDGEYLDMTVYNRSQDYFLGLPFNIASSALLLMIIAKFTHKTPRHMHMTLGDVHIYEPHFSVSEEQSKRIPFVFPSVYIDDVSLGDMTYENFHLENYQSYPVLKGEMIP